MTGEVHEICTFLSHSLAPNEIQQSRKHFFLQTQSGNENFWDNIPHNHYLIRIGHVNRTYIHIVTNLWKRICNFENIEITGISSPNTPTIICDLSQDEQVKQQCFKFWSHLTINFERYVYINVFAYLFTFVCLDIFCLSVLLSVSLSAFLAVWVSACLSVCLSACLSVCLHACLSACLSVCLFSLRYK